MSIVLIIVRTADEELLIEVDLMKTKEKYLLALDRIDNAYNNFDRSISAVGRFTQDLSLLLGLVNEYFEEKQETNFEHYKDEIRDAECYFAIRNGEVISCRCCSCSECLFFGNHTSCSALRTEWLYQKYQRKYKLTQFEYDLIKTFDRCKECCLLNEIECLKKLREKGYFNGIDPFTKVHEIIDNCEVIENGK